MNEITQKSYRDRGIVAKKNRRGITKYYARVVVTQGDGSKQQITMVAENKSHARRLRDDMARTIATQGTTYINGEKLKFRQLAEGYKERKLVPAKYHNGRKVAGLRSLSPVLSSLVLLIRFFGNQLIRKITPADIERYKQTRLDTPILRQIRTESGVGTIQRARAIASVNRELALLRSIFNDAVANSLLVRSPFQGAKGVVSLADEVRRERVLSFAEERLLLLACTDKLRVEYERAGKKIVANQNSRRVHLRPILITALDTAMRLGELLKLNWNEVDFASRTIIVLAMNTKTARPRVVGMTQRVFDELSQLWELSPKDRSGLVFGVRESVSKSFAMVCQAAGVEDFRFHDCRHTAITRMIAAGMSPAEVMKVSGHTQMSTFLRYVNPTASSVIRIATALDVLRDQAHENLSTISEAIN